MPGRFSPGSGAAQRHRLLQWARRCLPVVPRRRSRYDRGFAGLFFTRQRDQWFLPRRASSGDRFSLIPASHPVSSRIVARHCLTPRRGCRRRQCQAWTRMEALGLAAAASSNRTCLDLPHDELGGLFRMALHRARQQTQGATGGADAALGHILQGCQASHGGTATTPKRGSRRAIQRASTLCCLS